ncbi:odorant receptor 94a-like [Diachasmimorpha longicaudata]|uniref:odorant receptor 94a-like n=1 Tax=Diachasmimorpha longicaudata TaxID=58733 RepID=UPI0030B87C3B
MSQRKVFDNTFDKPLLIDTDYVAFNVKCLTSVGLWNPYKNHQKWLYHVYTVIVAFFIPLMRVDGFIMAIWHLQQSFVQQTLMLVIISVFVVGVLKHMNVLWHHSDIAFVATVFTWERSMVCSAEVAVYREKVVTQTMKIMKKSTLIWLWLAIFDLPFLYRRNVDENNRSVEQLSISFTIFGHYLTKLNFFTVLSLDYVTVVLSAWSVITNDCMFLSLMLQMKTQFQILNFRLKRCANQVQDYGTADAPPNNFEGSDGTIHKRHVNTNEELRICIQHYQKMFGLMRILNKVYGAVLLPQIISSVSLLTMMGVHVFMTQTVNFRDASDLIILMLTFTSALMEIGLYCLGGQTVMTESERTRAAVYDSEWYLQDSEFKNNLVTFLGMAGRPFSLRAAGFFEMSLVTLKSILSKSYSATAVLQSSLA